MSELTTYLKVGTTAIVLEMIEDGFIPPDFALCNSVQALKAISRDLTCRKTVPLQNGQQYSALELQQAYLDLAHRYYSTRPVSATVADLLRQWEHVLTALAEDPGQLHQEIDWVIKRYLLMAYAARSQRSPTATADRLLMLDLQYHDIRRSKGPYYLLERQGRVARIATETQIEAAMVDPPPDTRAKLRGDLIKFANLRRIPYEIDWNYIRIGYLLNLWVKCEDPFQYESDNIAHLIRRLEDAPMVGG
ncbi:MAG: proteasome accessory factor PafA2 family protein [bacterium]|nr:proteasome accessory factor PafA2 family protein [bacterium]